MLHVGRGPSQLAAEVEEQRSVCTTPHGRQHARPYTPDPVMLSHERDTSLTGQMTGWATCKSQLAPLKLQFAFALLQRSICLHTLASPGSI